MYWLTPEGALFLDTAFMGQTSTTLLCHLGMCMDRDSVCLSAHSDARYVYVVLVAWVEELWSFLGLLIRHRLSLVVPLCYMVYRADIPCAQSGRHHHAIYIVILLVVTTTSSNDVDSMSDGTNE